MSTSDSKRLDPGSLPVRVLMLAAGPDELLELLSGAAGELLLAVERCGRTLELDLRVLTAGPGGENAEENGQENGEPGGGASERLGELLGERGWAPVAVGEHSAGSLASTHGLAEELELRLSADHPGLVIAPAVPPDEPGGAASTDQRALYAALLAALRASPRPALLAGWKGEAPAGHRLVHHVGREAEPLLEVEPTRALELRPRPASGPTVSAVLSSFNKVADVRANLRALRAQTLPFDQVVVVDNASHDGSAEMVAREFPEVDLVVMPNSDYGACETFNIGFATAHSDHVAILDDDVVLPPEWLEKVLARMQAEPDTTAIVSTKVVEPGMPESYRNSESANRERYMSTFRGCASLARKQALSEAGGYDERLFIYGNERDLTCRLLNLGYRVLQYPGVETFHKTPFGVQMGKRSLYYHARNAWIGMLKYAPVEDLVRLPWLVLTKVLLRKDKAEAEGAVSDAVGTIGIGKSIRETRGSSWILLKALGSVIYNIPYCLRRREACRAPDFELPLH